MSVKPSNIPPSENRNVNSVWILVALAAVSFLSYASVFRYGFINYDDPDYITKNPQVSAGLTSHGIQWAFTTGHAANWHPLTWLSHMTDVQMFGLNAGPQHAVNLLFHIASALLLFRFL